jgi:hypothetical protein
VCVWVAGRMDGWKEEVRARRQKNKLDMSEKAKVN